MIDSKALPLSAFRLGGSDDERVGCAPSSLSGLSIDDLRWGTLKRRPSADGGRPSVVD